MLWNFKIYIIVSLNWKYSLMPCATVMTISMFCIGCIQIKQHKTPKANKSDEMFKIGQQQKEVKYAKKVKMTFG